MINEIAIQKIADANCRAGFKWFAPASMDFFQSEIYEPGYITNDGSSAFFVSSEKQDGSDRGFTIRKCDMQTGRICSYSHFMQYGTEREARIAAMRAVLAREEITSGENTRGKT